MHGTVNTVGAPSLFFCLCTHKAETVHYPPRFVRSFKIINLLTL